MGVPMGLGINYRSAGEMWESARQERLEYESCSYCGTWHSEEIRCPSCGAGNQPTPERMKERGIAA